MKKYLFTFVLLGFTLLLKAQKVDFTNPLLVDSLRMAINKTSGLSTRRSGDEYVFNMALEFVMSDHDTAMELRFIRRWNNMVPASKYGFWWDIPFLYRYFSGLNAEKLRKKGLLKESDFIYLNKNEESSPLYNVFYNAAIKPGNSIPLASGVVKTDVLRNDTVIGFLIKGQNLKLDFIFNGNKRIAFADLNKRYPSIVADFPLPMHTGGGKLIELGIQDGEIINYIFSGGNRRSGMVIIDQKGKSFPFHLQFVEPAVWTNAYPKGKYLDLVHNAHDLKKFLEIAKTEKLSMVMEMLLIDNTDVLSIRTMKDSREAGGRRMMVWENQKSGNPSLLVLKNGYFTRDLTSAAVTLGYKWGIYCDVNYYDNAGYWEKSQKRIQFSFYNEEENGKKKIPYHRMVLYQ
jgi:hypothetical protein